MELVKKIVLRKMFLCNCNKLFFLVANPKVFQRILPWTNPAVRFHLDLRGKIYPLNIKTNWAKKKKKVHLK